jgi:hypothetical protein
MPDEVEVEVLGGPIPADMGPGQVMELHSSDGIKRFWITHVDRDRGVLRVIPEEELN